MLCGTCPEMPSTCFRSVTVASALKPRWALPACVSGGSPIIEEFTTLTMAQNYKLELLEGRQLQLQIVMVVSGRGRKKKKNVPTEGNMSKKN